MNILQKMSLLLVSLLVSTTVLANSITDADYQEFSSDRIDAANVALEIANEALTVQAARMTQINDEILGQGCSNFGRNNYKCKRNTTKTSLLIGTFKQWKHEGMAIGQMADAAIQEKGRAVYFAKYGVEAPVPKVAAEAVEEDQIDPRLVLDSKLLTRFKSATNELAHFKLKLQGVKKNSSEASFINAKIQHQDNLLDQVLYEIKKAKLEIDVVQGAVTHGISEEEMRGSLEYIFVQLDDKKHRTDYRNMLDSIRLSGIIAELDANRPTGISKPEREVTVSGDDLASYKLANQIRARENAKRVRNGQESLNFFVDDIADELSDWSQWFEDSRTRTEATSVLFYADWVVVIAPSDQEFTTRSRDRFRTTTYSSIVISESRDRYIITRYLKDEVAPEGALREYRDRVVEAVVDTQPTQGQVELLFPNPDYVYVAPVVETPETPVEPPVVETPETPVEAPVDTTPVVAVDFLTDVQVAHGSGYKGKGVSVAMIGDATVEGSSRFNELRDVIASESTVNSFSLPESLNIFTRTQADDIIALSGNEELTTSANLLTTDTINSIIVIQRGLTATADALVSDTNVSNLIIAGAIDLSTKQIIGEQLTTENESLFLVVDADNSNSAATRIAGAIALVKGQRDDSESTLPTLTNAQITSLILATATDIGEDGIDNKYGNGELNLLKALSITQ